MSNAADIVSLTEKIQSAASGKNGFGKVIILDLNGEGVIRIDGSGETTKVSNEAGDGDATIRLSSDTLSRLMNGSMSATKAVMMGRVSLRGDASLALKLASFL